MDKMRTWGNAEEIDQYLIQFDSERLSYAYSLTHFWDDAFYAPNYETSPLWDDLVHYSDYGKQLTEIIKLNIQRPITEQSVKECLFRIFTYHDFIIDWNQSDLEGIEHLLISEISSERIIFPNRFGRLLYDRFNDKYSGSQTDHLSAEQGFDLLSGTPRGVYQLGPLVLGPLGLLRSMEKRYLPPSNFLGLWHCSDTGCSSRHSVRLLRPKTDLFFLEDQIFKILSNSFGPRSLYHSCLVRLCFLPPKAAEQGIPFYDLPVLIADSIIGNERSYLTEAAIKGEHGKYLRKVLSLPPNKKEKGYGDAKLIANNLTPEEQLQLLLVLPDKIITSLIDSLVFDGQIQIPYTQVRNAKESPSSTTLSSETELSILGLRSVKDDPIAMFVRLVYDAYQSKDNVGELLWRTVTPSGVSPLIGLMTYFRREGARTAVKDLILSSHSVTEFICEKIGLPKERIIGKKLFSIDMILWKFGFNPPQYDDFSERFKANLDKFENAIHAFPDRPSDDDRESIRSAGVNLFVYVEQMLDVLLSFNIWLLSTDHFLDSKMQFEISEARRKVSDALGASIISGDITLSWDYNGGNPLGVLLGFLSESSNWMKSLDFANRDNFKRVEEDIPFFATALYKKFPFQHNMLWADSDPSEFQIYLAGYSSLISLIQRADLGFIRNGLDHMRDPNQFPKADSMLACAARIREAHNLAISKRFLPVVYWLDCEIEGRFGTIDWHLKDSTNRDLVIQGPQMALCLKSPNFSEPYIVAPGNLLGGSNATLIFRYAVNSDYDEYWRDYPRRNRIQAACEEAGTGSICPPNA